MLRGSGPQHESSGSVDSLTFPVSRGSSEAVVQQSSQLLLPSSARPDRSAVSETHVDNLLLGSYGQKHSCSPEEPIEAHPKSSNQRRINRLRRKADFRQQDEKLAAAASKILDLEDAVSTLQRLLAADRGLISTEDPPIDGASLSSRIRASSSALQTEKVLLSARKHKLQCLHEQQGRVSQGPSLPSAASLLPPTSDTPQLSFDGSAVSAARKRHLQSLRPHAAWKGCTPVPMDVLYSSILEGYLDLDLPLTNGQAYQRGLQLRHLVAMPLQQQLSLQEQYHGCLAGSAPFCSKPGSTHSRHFQALMGEAMVLLAVFSECKPEQFLACQSSSMLDGSRMPPEARENLKVASHKICLNADQLTTAQRLQAGYAQELAACHAERQQLSEASEKPLDMSAASLPELSAPNQAVNVSSDISRLSNSLALQQEVYLHLIRGFLLEVLTPLQCGQLCAAAYPYLPEFASLIGHILSNPDVSMQASPGVQL